MERRRLEETDQTAPKVWRRGWCLGSRDFKKTTLEKIQGKLGDHHSGELRREIAEAKGERLIAEELKRLGWNERDLAVRCKSDAAKLGLASRLRKETTLSTKAITARVHLGTSKSANPRLHNWMAGAELPDARGQLGI